VSIRLHDGMCIYTVENSKIMNAREDNGGKSGIGLQNVARRLELSYPGKYTLQVNDQPDRYAVQLNLTLS
jgi:two-component system sensor histidine kinase AlgZ